eukprot:SAG25_NODE_1430_length_3044_cov_4.352122_2_plen_234_part_00
MLPLTLPSLGRCREFLATAAKVARRNVYDVRSGWLDGVEWEKYVKELFLVTTEQVMRVWAQVCCDELPSHRTDLAMCVWIALPQVQTGAAVIYDAPNKQFYAHGLPTTEAELQVGAAVGGRNEPVCFGLRCVPVHPCTYIVVHWLAEPDVEVHGTVGWLQALIDDTLAKKIPPTNTERGVQKAAKRVFVQFAEFLEENPWAIVILVLPLVGLGYLAFRVSGDTGAEDDPDKTK